MRIFPVRDISRYKVSDDIPKDEVENYNSNKEYNLYDRVKYGKYIYTSLSPSNKALPTDTIKWEQINIANECAYLDGVVSNRSCSPNDINIEFKVPDDAEIIAIGGLKGREIEVTLLDSGGGVVFSETQTLDTYRPPKMCWYDWVYPKGSDVEYKNSYVKKIIPAPDQTLKIKITKGFCGACIGLLAMGATVWIGCTFLNVKREIKGSLTVDILRTNRRALKARRGYIKLIASVKMSDETNPKVTTEQTVDDIQLRLEKYLNIPIGLFADDTGDSYSMMAYGIYDTIQSTIRPIGGYEIILQGIDNIF